MTTNNKQIVAIGGGGFSSYGSYCPKNLLIEEYILKQTGKKRPSICFIPTASAEAPKYILIQAQNENLGRVKASGLNDRKQPHISNIGSFTIVQSRELSRWPKFSF